jgi:hypothetical protein
MVTETAVLRKSSGTRTSMVGNAKLAESVTVKCIPLVMFHPKHIGIAGVI